MPVVPATHLPDILTELAVILCVAAVTTILFQRIKQPVVLGYLLAGLIVGPHVPIPLFASAELAHPLSELGVILLMFSIGLEFSLRKLARVGPIAGVVAIIECSFMIWIGYTAATLFGWTRIEALFTGALVAISSTTIIVKVFREQNVSRPLSELVLGILIVEDVIAILLLAVLTAVASGKGLSTTALAMTVGKLAGFLVLLLAGGIFVVPRLVKYVVKLGRTETTIVASVGICFAFALLARALGYSVALGAFVGGALVAESGEGKTIEKLIEPIREMFAAIFFVSVGMLIDPGLIAQHWTAVLGLTVVVLFGKVVSVSLGAFIAGSGVSTSLHAGMSLAQIGEFSFIIAGVGLSLGVIGDFLYPVAVAVSAVTALTTPALVRRSGRVAAYVEQRLPQALQTYASLYGTWVQQLRTSAPTHGRRWSRIQRMLGLLMLDVFLIAIIVIAASLASDRIVRFAAEAAHLSSTVAKILLVLAALAVAAPFLLGAVRTARALGLTLAAEALPSSEGLDLAAAPRRALLVTLQLATLLLAGIPLVALTQPFLPSFPSAALLFAAVALLAIPFWRSATNLHGHVRAGAQVLFEALAAQSQSRETGPHQIKNVGRLMPGLGEPATIWLGPEAACVGKSLKALNVRGLTGATVLAIERPSDEVVFPGPDEILRQGDTLLLTGTRETVEAAKELLGEAGPQILHDDGGCPWQPCCP